MNGFNNNNMLPRESAVGREVYMERRASTNRAAIFGVAGLLVLCACLCIGVAGLSYYFGSQGGQISGFALPSLGSSPTATPKSTKATPVPYQKSAKDDSGLRVTVTAYQRPLPAQDVKIPSGQELVLVTIKIENTRTTGGPLAYAPDDFKLVTLTGEEYSPDAGSITTGEMLKKGEVAAGKSAKGDIVYYIYSDAQELQLAWTSSNGETRMFALGRGK